MNKKIWWTIGILLVVATTLLILKKKEIIGKKEAVKVATEKIIRRTIIETVSASGKVFPEDERKVSSDVSGEVVEMYVEEGDSNTGVLSQRKCEGGCCANIPKAH